MSDLISRQAAIDEVVNWLKDRMTDVKNGKPLTDRLKDLPSAQPERPKGEWVLQSDDYHEYYECDQCGMAVGLDDVRNFCCNCGTDMRGKQDE